MSTLAYMTPRGAGHVRMGRARGLGLTMADLRRRATLRSDHGAIIGESVPCDGGCDGKCHGWHWWFDAEGDNVKPEPGE